MDRLETTPKAEGKKCCRLSVCVKQHFKQPKVVVNAQSE